MDFSYEFRAFNFIKFETSFRQRACQIRCSLRKMNFSVFLVKIVKETEATHLHFFWSFSSETAYYQKLVISHVDLLCNPFFCCARSKECVRQQHYLQGKCWTNCWNRQTFSVMKERNCFRAADRARLKNDRYVMFLVRRISIQASSIQTLQYAVSN